MNKGSIFSLLIEGLVFATILLFVWDFFDDKLDRSEQNLIAYRGQVEELQMKNGELLTARDSYILRTSELGEELGVTKRELKDLKKKLGASVSYIAELEMRTRVDTTIIVRDSIIYKEPDRLVSKFLYSDQWFKIEGTHESEENHSNTTFNTIEVYTPLQVGLADNYKIWVKSENPYVQFTDINGAVIDGSKFHPKENKFSLGIQVGVGGMYDIIDKDISLGPYAGVGLNIKF